MDSSNPSAVPTRGPAGGSHGTLERPPGASTPPGAPPEPGAAGTGPRRYTFRRALGHSSLLHGLILLALLLTGAGLRAPEPWLGRPRPASGAQIAFLTPAPAPAERRPEPEREPERPLEAPALPEPELRERELDLPAPPRPEPEPELAELDPLEPLRRLPLEPLRRLEPRVPEVAAAEPDPAEPPSAPESAPAPPDPAQAPEGIDRHPPVSLYAPAPEYPLASYRMGHEGAVLVRIHVSPQGTVVEVELVESSGHERLDQAALATVRTWRFRPGTEDGASVQGSLLHRVVFRIES